MCSEREADVADLIKYPRTPHLLGSGLQAGDDAATQIPLAALAGKHLVIEEKLDGANSGVRFDGAGELRLQSRGHYLTGGPREKHFALLKTWASAHAARLLQILGDRYVMYGEWMHAKHTVFYDRLPHFFLEFDVLDTASGAFLSTAARRALLADAPVVSVPVVYDGPAPRRIEELTRLVRPSLAKSATWRQALRDGAARLGLDVARVVHETEDSDLSEGLYIKVEAAGVVEARLKWVRRDFTQSILDSDGHWLARPIVPNQLRDDADLYAPSPVGWPGEYAP
jgi:hypothetical protein